MRLYAETYAWPRICAASCRLSWSPRTPAIGFSSNGPPPLVRFMIWSADRLEALQHALPRVFLASRRRAVSPRTARGPSRTRRPSTPPAPSRTGRRRRRRSNSRRRRRVPPPSRRASRRAGPSRRVRKRLKRSSFSSAWWCPSEPPRMRIESRVDSAPFMKTWPAAAWPASWIATARVSDAMYSIPIAVPDSIVVIASTRSLPGEVVATLVVGDRQRHRADLVDHRRRVAVRDPCDLVASLGRIELGLVRDPRDVEVEDVEPVLLRRRPERDVAAHATGPDQGGIEPFERDVRRADEVDLVASRPRRRQPEPDLAERGEARCRWRRGRC